MHSGRAEHVPDRLFLQIFCHSGDVTLLKFLKSLQLNADHGQPQPWTFLLEGLHGRNSLGVRHLQYEA
jgi:hypothetical protein